MNEEYGMVEEMELEEATNIMDYESDEEDYDDNNCDELGALIVKGACVLGGIGLGLVAPKIISGGKKVAKWSKNKLRDWVNKPDVVEASEYTDDDVIVDAEVIEDEE